MTTGKPPFPVLSGRVPAAVAVSVRGLDVDAFAAGLAREGLLDPGCAPPTFAAVRRYLEKVTPGGDLDAVYARFPQQFLRVPAARVVEVERAAHLRGARLHPALAAGTTIVAGSPDDVALVRALLAQERRPDIGVVLTPDEAPMLVRLGDDGGLGWAVARALDSVEHGVAEGALSGFHRYGIERSGPVLTGFAQWALDHLRSLGGARRAFGVMREGRHLADVMRTLARPTDPAIGDLWLSRYVALKAAITDSTADALPNLFWRARRRPVTVSVALGFWALAWTPDCPFGPDEAVDATVAPEFIEWLIRVGHMDHILAQAADLRSRLMAHLRGVGALGAADGPLVLVDMGYAANIQRALEVCLRAEGVAVQTVGLYLVTGPGVVWAQQSGCRVLGYLTQNGVPEDFMAVFARTPEVLELCAGDPRGSLVGFAPDGQPELDAECYGQEQWRQMKAVQDGALAVARAWAASGHAAPPAEAVRNRVRSMILQPTPDEAALIGAWVYDANGGTSASRRLTDCLGASDIPGRDALYWPQAAKL